MAMTGRTPGLVVLYRWRVHTGQEDAFVAAWSTITASLRRQCGSLGSRLHRGTRHGRGLTPPHDRLR
jgi:heme-degrading monooxygenase HmoA